MRHRGNILAAVLAALLLAAVILALILLPPPGEGQIRFIRSSFDDLPGWHNDKHAEALSAFLKSCEALVAASPGAPPSSRLGGEPADWSAVCEAAGQLPDGNEIAARELFEESFALLSLAAGTRTKGQLTGYYEPLVAGSETRSADFPIPLYKRPPELVTVSLGRFRKDLAGRRIAGRVLEGRLAPFETRAEIESGALEGRGLELFWLRDPVDAFFLQIQGSGRIRLPDGRLRRVGYDGPNGHPYTSIGRLLVARGEMALDEVSMQSIRRWIESNPEKGRALMRENASYVFFRELEGDEPVGSLGVGLTPGRSLAVDPLKLPLGAPVYLVGDYPDPSAPGRKVLPLERLMIAQDTGGAIRGALRGDVFWGRGAAAEIIAGHMNNRARIYLLLPHGLAARLLED